jgi:spermidine/putrescine transport system permease protein
MRQLKRLAYPYVLWILVFTIAPLLLVAFYAFTAYDASGNIYFTTEGFIRIFKGDKVLLSAFGLDAFQWMVPANVNIFCRSLEIALIATGCCLLIGYPVAYYLAQRSKQRRGKPDFLLFLFIMPMWMNALLRTYAWLAILEPKGLLNTFFVFIGLPAQELIYNQFGVGLGMVYNYLPFMVLPIYSVLAKVNQNVVEAAEDLGANQLQTFMKVVFPLSLPGIVSGINMVFLPSMTTFLIPDLLGGGRYFLIGNVIEREYMISRDWTTASALSILLLLFILISLRILRNYESKNEGGNVLL